MKSIFAVYKQIFPPNDKPYIIIETNYTSDGLRSRICANRYDNEDAALDVKREKENMESD